MSNSSGPAVMTGAAGPLSDLTGPDLRGPQSLNPRAPLIRLRPVIELLPVACAARGPRFIKSRVYAVSRDLRLRLLAARLRVCVEDNRLFIGAPGPTAPAPTRPHHRAAILLRDRGVLHEFRRAFVGVARSRGVEKSQLHDITGARKYPSVFKIILKLKLVFIAIGNNTILYSKSKKTCSNTENS